MKLLGVSRLTRVALAAALLAGLLVNASDVARAQSRDTTSGADTLGHLGLQDDRGAELFDLELVTALEATGRWRVWVDGARHSPVVARLKLDADPTYRELRAELLQTAADLAERRGADERLRAQAGVVADAIADASERAREERVLAASSGRMGVDTSEGASRPRSESEVSLALTATSPDLDLIVRSLQGLLEVVGDRPDPRRKSGSADAGAGVGKSDRVGVLSLVLVELARLDSQVEALQAEASTMSKAESALSSRLDELIDQMQARRATGESGIDGLPFVVLDAYVRGADGRPASCSVDWRLLAGIGRVESIHGTLGGASVAANGWTGPAIFGPLLDGGASEREAAEAAEAARIAEQEAERMQAEEEARLAAQERARLEALYAGAGIGPTLGRDEAEARETDEADTDGASSPEGLDSVAAPGAESSVDTDGDPGEGVDENEGSAEAEGNGFAVIEDSDGGALDGNARWDRAVGPMQFLPATWRLYGRDGNQDGVVDPHNVYDAAASATDYLCDLERRNGSDPRAFVLGYNNSSAYVDLVLAYANSLEDYDLTDPMPGSGAGDTARPGG